MVDEDSITPTTKSNFDRKLGGSLFPITFLSCELKQYAKVKMKSFLSLMNEPERMTDTTMDM